MFVSRVRHGGDVWDKPEGVMDFSANTNPLGPPSSLLGFLSSNLGLIARYPDPEHRIIRGVLSDLIGVGFKNVLVGCGATELIYLAVQACLKLCGGGLHVLIPEPTFGEYEVAARRLGGRPSYVFADRVDLRFDDDEIIRNLPHNGLVFICNPNNPTGQSFGSKSVEEVVAEADKRHSVVVVDESLVEFTPTPEANSVIKMVEGYDNLVVLRSPAKLFAIPGLRIGYAVASTRIAHLIRSLQQPWSVGVLGELGLPVALRDFEFISTSTKYVRLEREVFAKKLGKIRGLRVYPSDANFLLVDTNNWGIGGRELKRRLISKGVLVRECSDFRSLGDHHIRLAVRRHEENEYLLKVLGGLLGA
ncbi:MAG: histidinol-phosphate transaminase [Thermoprotei archaeon]